MKKFYSYFFLFVIPGLAISCSNDDDQIGFSGQYFKANINGLEFNSGEDAASLFFNREIGPDGRVRLFGRALSANGDMMEFLIENYQGVGKYYFGNNLYNNSWIKYESTTIPEKWLINTGGALNLTSNFIEITSSDDLLIEGAISCKELKSPFEDIFGVIDGNFRLKYKP